MRLLNHEIRGPLVYPESGCEEYILSPALPLYIVSVCNNIGYKPPIMALIKNTSDSSLIASNGNHLSVDEGKGASQKLAMKRSNGHQEMGRMITKTWTAASLS